MSDSFYSNEELDDQISDSKTTKDKVKIVFGSLFLFFSIFILFSSISFYFTGKLDFDLIVSDVSMLDAGTEVENWLGYFGAFISHFLIYEGFGIASILLVPLFLFSGLRLVFKDFNFSISYITYFSIFFIIWITSLMGFILTILENNEFLSFYSGKIGHNLALLFQNLFGLATPLILLLLLFIFLIYQFKIYSFSVPISLFNFSFLKTKSSIIETDKTEEKIIEDEDIEDKNIETENNDFDKDKEINDLDESTDELNIKKEKIDTKKTPSVDDKSLEEENSDNLELKVEKFDDPERLSKIDIYDPKLDLSSYKYPKLDSLKDYPDKKIQVSKDELESNKDKIVETLKNFKIEIAKIKATIGPTVTLYEIVPEAGIKISKIKNLEDDIALSLSALGIRIIAPIPGKGTIGIEVPNKNRQMVDLKSVMTTEAFVKSDYDLPVIMGKTISNEVYVSDLSKMPHILIAGATGQGKSVGLNVMLASLLYKKHPSQLKFVLVDPKKVELTLFNKIEKHFLAKLPDSEEAIITETKKVVHTLNSLCIEMDVRYNLLKDAQARNIKEYNEKFEKRKLNPNEGHRFLPYIVLVIDELADLMMTAGKEIENPIARLAQLARAIGIHLVVATQRPSVNVITGVIKANFPARLSFRVTSKVDSRTILDIGGAEQLVGMGDMLLSGGSDLVRLQGPFIDTDEIKNICVWIGDQRGYESAYKLPEYIDENEKSLKEVDLSDRDALFEEAARLLVLHQQGSTSLIQRKLKLGYNRAGRLIDQLESAGIVGPFEGSKAREVLIPDEYSLEKLLNELE
tara:strand:+ start:1803 stop:4205 length:2403 start_codon:yes stop_codon:yes gene_type:complete